MAITTLVLHLPAHRRRAVQIEKNTADAEQAYDANIGAYLEFLSREAQAAGFALLTDQRDDGPAFSFDEVDGAQKRAAHDWLETQPDIWNWMPSAP